MTVPHSFGLAPGQARHLEPAEVAGVLDSGRVLSETDTHLTGLLRLLELPGFPGERWILEQDLKRRPVLRRLAPDQDADAFIEQRLAAYDRMWDG